MKTIGLLLIGVMLCIIGTGCEINPTRENKINLTTNDIEVVATEMYWGGPRKDQVMISCKKGQLRDGNVIQFDDQGKVTFLHPMSHDLDKAELVIQGIRAYVTHRNSTK